MEIDTDKLVQSSLAACERALDDDNADEAEYWLNDAAARFREAGIPNTSPRYRLLSGRAVSLRTEGSWTTGPTGE